ncbi:putative class V chitinase [Aspergillus ibericus CBS 121593]|uniref:chitinase n=1 Tax=Aspergillus ibericus CBS 121593 TaxID=1448316 RepID=A0A395H916_9EURO|nr:class V chitinase [Aspergillus ibericus CBS 121593]RAL04126.1 class V chitinase [Aspergillus ibericus CBS 121593]
MRTTTLSSLTFLLSLSVIGRCDDIACSESNPCTEGCCSKLSAVCGYGPDYCSSDNCIAAASTNGTCSQLSDCDPSVSGWTTTAWGSEYASSEKCPLNVCCSAYGFCGTTSDFCGNTTVAEPVCEGSSATKKTIAYYEGWNLERSCDTMPPESIPIGGYTHLNFAFLYIDPDLYTITPMATDQEDLYSRVVALKKKKTDLEVWISIGGWAFNDPGSTVNTFSDLAASTSKQKTFFQSLLSFLNEYGFDGVDLDWEYPVASDRGGSEADFDNYVSFLANLRTALDSAGKGYGLTITLPSSYWYLQHFDVVNLAKSVDWFNMMTYDLHGGWDAEDPWIGSIVNAHTNLTEITLAMDLLWRNDIEPSQVVMGLGFYGRSKAGPCTASAGILSFTEIESILKDSSRGATKFYDSDAAVQIVTFDSNQWVSYDDWESFAVKMDYANSHCIGGTMVWAVTYDSDGTATNGLTGDLTLFPGDDGSNGGEGDIYIGPDLWTNTTHEISCYPPCTMVLPPYPLETGVTIEWPPITTSFASSSDGQTLTKTTTITVPPFHITQIPFWPITVPDSSVDEAYMSPLQSITPPGVVITLPGTEAEFPLYHTNYSAIGAPSATATTTTTTGNVTAIGGVPGGATGSSSVVTTPAAVQTGIVSGCTEFYYAVAGDTCAAIAAAYAISLTEFYASDTACVTWCTTMTFDCEPTGGANLLIASMDIDDLGNEIYSADDDALSSSAWSAASWLNPRYTGWDPITINGTTLGVSGPAPTVAITSSTASKTTATAVSVTSCGLQTTSTGSSPSTYCTCNGGYGLALSTKTNAAHSTFLICAADPPLTVTTITPTTTTSTTTQPKTTSTTTTTAAQSSTTGFAITYIQCSSSICPVGKTCESDGSFNFMGVQPFGDDDDDELVQISGSYNKEALVNGGKAKFCGQTSKFTVKDDTVTGSSSKSEYGTYSCLKYSDATSLTIYDKDNGITCESTPQYACLTEICL